MRPQPHSGQKRRCCGLPVPPGLVKVFSVPVTFSAGAGTPTTEGGAGEVLAVGAVAHADEDGLRVRAVAHLPAQAAAVDACHDLSSCPPRGRLPRRPDRPQSTPRTLMLPLAQGSRDGGPSVR